MIAIDGATNRKIARIPAGWDIAAFCYNPTNNKVYCANWNNATVTVIDGATNAVVATVDVGRAPLALCYNPTDNKVYCANYDDNVTVIDGATNQVVATRSYRRRTQCPLLQPDQQQGLLREPSGATT